MIKFADVIVDISHEKVDRTFQYRIPSELEAKIIPGSCVKVPFGKGNKIISGYVIDVSENPNYPIEKLKFIESLTEREQSVEGKLIQTAFWMKNTYGGTMIQSLKTVLPVKQKVRQSEKKEIVLLTSVEETKAAVLLFEKKHQLAKVRVLTALLEEAVIPWELMSQKLHVSASTIDRLQRDRYLLVRNRQRRFLPGEAENIKQNKVILSDEQQVIVDKVKEDMQNGVSGNYLIHGITGSGKTQVYLELAKNTAAAGKQVIMLIPEISLTYQTVMRFYHLFGERVSVMNSTLSQGERYEQYEKAKNGMLDVIIGPRSALFTPFQNLGMIIIDEEHENSYKSETMPRYHARETAQQIASLHNAALVLGSATPSLTAYHKAKHGEYQLFQMTRRLTGQNLPKVDIIDLREELKHGNRSIFSEALRALMDDRLKKKEQMMLFINRRGYAGFVSCRSCGYVVKCPHCDVSMTEHNNGKMVCHYCGYTTVKLSKCPQCGSKYIFGFKAGTQQIEEEVKKYFPTAKVLRMDGDTTKKKGDYDRILQGFANQEADILIGTQMIVKGHDFPNVTLVGVLAADLSLNTSDYRAGERTFQLLTQAAGRAGRGSAEGEVVIQTYQPEHYSIIHAAKQDYKSFYEEEMCYRDLMGYPPAAHLLAVLIVAKEEKRAFFLAEQFAMLVKSSEKDQEDRVTVVGPAPAGIAKINDYYRVSLLLKHASYVRLTALKDQMESYYSEIQGREDAVQYDFDPMNVF